MNKTNKSADEHSAPIDEQLFEKFPHERMYEICLNRSLVLAARKIRLLYESRIKSLGINSSQLSLLFEVKLCKSLDSQNRCPTLSEVAYSLDVIVSTVSHACKPLIRDGLIAIQSDPYDGRIKRIVITSVGEKILLSAITLLSALNSEIRGELGEEEFKSFMVMTGKICSGELSEKILAKATILN